MRAAATYVRCPACGRRNPADARGCRRCQRNLIVLCDCGAEVSEVATACPACGAAWALFGLGALGLGGLVMRRRRRHRAPGEPDEEAPPTA